MKYTEDEKKFYNLILHNVESTLAGQANAYTDGEIEEEELLQFATVENAIKLGYSELEIARKQGHLESCISNKAMEVKHINFLGNERIELLISKAAEKAIGRFEYLKEVEGRVIYRNLSHMEEN